MLSKFLVVAAACVLMALTAEAKVCHNITGTCLSQGFICANEQVVPHAQRCDGVEDCADGTDEFMCDHEDHRPLHERPDHDRHAFEQASCVKCECKVNQLTITSGTSSWFNFAVVSPTDKEGLMTGAANQYGGMPCNSKCVTSIKMNFYKKSGICRGWLCCARQVQCMACSSTGSCPASNSPAFDKRCYRS